MPTAFAVAAAISALLAIIADWNERRHFTFYLLKPLTTLLIIGIAASTPVGDAESRILLLFALTLSLLGDICLMFAGDTGPERSEVGAGAGETDVSRTRLLTQDAVSTSDGARWFIGGIGSFLLAHLLFIPVLLHGIAHPALPLWSGALAIYGIGLFGWLLPKTGHLKIAVTIYGLALMGLAFAAVARWYAHPDTNTQLALAGALLFVLSDSSLAVRKFAGRYAGAQALILSTYWAAIGLIAHAATQT